MKARTIGLVLIAIGLVGLISTAWGFAASGHDLSGRTWGPWSGLRGGGTCSPPALSGETVDVTLSDMGGGMMGGHMMDVTASPSTVAGGDVSFRVWNQGTMVHELVVLPLPTDGAGTRPVGVDGRVSESGSLGEASNACGEGAGGGSLPARLAG